MDKWSHAILTLYCRLSGLCVGILCTLVCLVCSCRCLGILVKRWQMLGLGAIEVIVDATLRDKSLQGNCGTFPRRLMPQSVDSVNRIAWCRSIQNLVAPSRRSKSCVEDCLFRGGDWGSGVWSLEGNRRDSGGYIIEGDPKGDLNIGTKEWLEVGKKKEEEEEEEKFGIECGECWVSGGNSFFHHHHQ